MVGPFPILTPIARGGSAIAEVWSRWLTGLVAQVNASAAAVLTGTGDPNGVVAAPQGTVFLRSDGGATTTLYVKTSGGTTPTTTVWTAK